MRVSSDAGPDDLSFLANPRYAEQAETTRAAAVVLPPAHETALPSLVSREPLPRPSRAPWRSCGPRQRPAAGVHASAQVDSSAVLGDGVYVGPLAVVGRGRPVGARSVIHAHVVLYTSAEIGDDCVLHSGVSVREGCRLGHRVVVQNGAVIGSDGFGFARDADGRYQKFPQVGIVVIEDDVEIGALTAIDRAALGETRIGRGSKLDNLVQIGHSVTIGEDTVIAAQVGIAGSTKIGRRVTLAGQVGIAGHIEIGDGVIVTAQSGHPGLARGRHGRVRLSGDREPRLAQVDRGLREAARSSSGGCASSSASSSRCSPTAERRFATASRLGAAGSGPSARRSPAGDAP